jgi:hypothetical protein
MPAPGMYVLEGILVVAAIGVYEALVAVVTKLVSRLGDG